MSPLHPLAVPYESRPGKATYLTGICASWIGSLAAVDQRTGRRSLFLLRRQHFLAVRLVAGLVARAIAVYSVPRQPPLVTVGDALSHPDASLDVP